MKETSKAMRRRAKETDFPWVDIFKGQILDVGSGDDPLKLSGPNVTTLDLPDGSGDDPRPHIPSILFDCIHGSQVLEHAMDPVTMLRWWIACLKPGGYIVATVPDWKLYEKCVWPSRWNAGHRSIWTMDVNSGAVLNAVRANAIYCKLPEWLNQFGCKILLCRLVDTNYDYNLGADVDQTFDASKGVECFHEFVLQKTK